MRVREELYAPKHPLANKRGIVLRHRALLYDHIGPGEHPCHWCGKLLHWTVGVIAHAEAISVDHVDGDCSNNEIENLVPSCRRCNSNRNHPRAIPAGHPVLVISGIRHRAVERICPVCGNTFLTKLSGKTRFCSRYCSIAGRGNSRRVRDDELFVTEEGKRRRAFVLTCGYCGKTTVISLSRKGRAKYCSKTCMLAALHDRHRAKYGHAITPENAYIDPKRGRPSGCRTCRSDRSLAWQREHRRSRAA